MTAQIQLICRAATVDPLGSLQRPDLPLSTLSKPMSVRRHYDG